MTTRREFVQAGGLLILAPLGAAASRAHGVEVQPFAAAGAPRIAALRIRPSVVDVDPERAARDRLDRAAHLAAHLRLLACGDAPRIDWLLLPSHALGAPRDWSVAARRACAVTLDGPELALLSRATRDAGCSVTLGAWLAGDPPAAQPLRRTLTLEPHGAAPRIAAPDRPADWCSRAGSLAACLGADARARLLAHLEDPLGGPPPVGVPDHLAWASSLEPLWRPA